MLGTDWRSIRKHYSLIPLYFFMFGGVGLAAFYTIRLATKSPEVTWNRQKNPEPWNEYATKQHKFYSPVRDYSNIQSPAPNYRED